MVESFRRIVRYQVRKQNGKRLSRSQLRKIVRDQIAGIDINEEAVRVSAFSLYLAFLHYQEPLDQIRKQEKRVAEMQQVLDLEKTSLNKLLQAKKVLES